MTTNISDRVLKIGDTIEIAQFDERCNMNLRRVRVKSLATVRDRHRIIGVNMHGMNPMNYELPAEPFTELTALADATIWTFTETVPGEE